MLQFANLYAFNIHNLYTFRHILPIMSGITNLTSRDITFFVFPIHIVKFFQSVNLMICMGNTRNVVKSPDVLFETQYSG